MKRQFTIGHFVSLLSPIHGPIFFAKGSGCDALFRGRFEMLRIDQKNCTRRRGAGFSQYEFQMMTAAQRTERTELFSLLVCLTLQGGLWVLAWCCRFGLFDVNGHCVCYETKKGGPGFQSNKVLQFFPTDRRGHKKMNVVFRDGMEDFYFHLVYFATSLLTFFGLFDANGNKKRRAGVSQ